VAMEVCYKKRLFSDSLWIKNMVVCRLGGALKLSVGLMG